MSSPPSLPDRETVDDEASPNVGVWMDVLACVLAGLALVLLYRWWKAGALSRVLQDAYIADVVSSSSTIPSAYSTVIRQNLSDRLWSVMGRRLGAPGV